MGRLQKAGPVRGAVVFPVGLAETYQQIGQPARFTEIQIVRLHDIPALKSRVLDVVLLEDSGGLLHRVPELLGAESAYDMPSEVVVVFLVPLLTELPRQLVSVRFRNQLEKIAQIVVVPGEILRQRVQQLGMSGLDRPWRRRRIGRVLAIHVKAKW